MDSLVSPAASRPRRRETGNRRSRMQGLPVATAGLMVIRSKRIEATPKSYRAQLGRLWACVPRPRRLCIIGNPGLRPARIGFADRVGQSRDARPPAANFTLLVL